MADNNIFGVVNSLSSSNSKWIKTSQDLMCGLVENIQDHLDNVEDLIKCADKSDCNISDLQNIYSIRLDVYEAIVNLMTKINDAAKSEMSVQKKMYDKGLQRYKDIFEAIKSQI